MITGAKMARKEDKLRPYRVDYFNIDEMKDNDKALVRSAVLRAVTSAEAAGKLLSENSTLPIMLIRSYRFYKPLGAHKYDVYKAVEDLFSEKNAIIVMEAVERYRAEQAQTNDLGNNAASQAQMDAIATQADAAVSQKVFETLRQMLIEHLGVGEDMTATTSFVDDLGADSLDQIELVMAVEEVFNIEIPDDDAERLHTVGDAVDFISRKVGSSVFADPTALTPEEQAALDFLQQDTPEAKGHITRYSDSSLYDEVCTKCGATDRDGKLTQTCPVSIEPPAPPIDPDWKPGIPSSGTESPVVAEAQEKAPDAVAVRAYESVFPPPEAFTDKGLIEPLIEPGKAVGPAGRPNYNPFVVNPSEPYSLKTLAITVITLLILGGLIYVFRPH